MFKSAVVSVRIAAGVAISQALMIESKQVQQRRVQVVNVDLVLDGLEAELIGSAVVVASLDAAEGQPHGKVPMVVIAAVDLAGVVAGQGQLDCRRAAKFAAPNE
jgi:hypothetical protein